MKVCIFQPPYFRDLTLSDEYFAYRLSLLDKYDESLDIIVLPEYSDVPCAAEAREDNLYYHGKYFDTLINKSKETAKRCNSLLFVNALSEENGNYRNTTFAFGRDGNLLGKFFKPYINLEIIEKAHAHGIVCNVFWSDAPEEAKKFLKMGVDTVLTNDDNIVSQII